MKPAYLCTLPQREIQQNTFQLNHYPQINLNIDTFGIAGGGGSSLSSRCSDSCRNVLIPVNESIIKRIISIFFENGFSVALNEARNEKDGNSWLAFIAEYIYYIAEFVKQWKTEILPHDYKHNASAQSVAYYSENRDWNNSHIRCMAWHPNCFKFAVAGVDDIVRIYTDKAVAVSFLKSITQRWITSMAWRPYTPGELAVGCQKGICVWSVDTNTHITGTTSQLIFLEQDSHRPVTCIQWNTDGTLLASVSIGDTNVIIWHVDKMQNTCLKRVGPPCSLIKWSPDGTSVFTSTVGNVFRVWSTNKKWLSDRWTISTGHIQSACWSTCGSFLLFVTSDECTLYRLQFFEEQYFKRATASKLALPVADLSAITIADYEIGGQPQTLAWDPNGLYLAITFKDTPCVAIYSTCIQKFKLTISPSCFIPPKSHNEYPCYINFQSTNRNNTDSILSIAWSSGRVQFCPFVNI